MLKRARTLASKSNDTMLGSAAEQARVLQRFLEKARGHVVVLTGAGVSTDSGIPDYRGPNGVYIRNKDSKPIQYDQFIHDHSYRQQYWARSFLLWPNLSIAKPSPAHRAITTLQQHGVVSTIITQNIDRLHSTSGATGVLELHGTLHEIGCIDCAFSLTRHALQNELTALNPEVAEWSRRHPMQSCDVSASVNPDDVPWSFDAFEYPKCTECGGILKPKVVFFGEDLPDRTADECWAAIDAARALLVVGSSLQVNTASSLCWQAYERKTPIAILNQGPTTGDEICDLRMEAGCSDVLPLVADAMTATCSSNESDTNATDSNKKLRTES